MTSPESLIALIDLTKLGEAVQAEDIRKLCHKALATKPAAVCVDLRFAELARSIIAPEGDIKLAVVVNFPQGNNDDDAVIEEIRQAKQAGAHEIDYVLDWRKLLDGEANSVAKQVAKIIKAANADGTTPVKVIIESGELKDKDSITLATNLALDAGAAFVKTSTGFASRGASLDAAETMLKAMQKSKADAGLKVSGGIRTLEEARKYYDLASSFKLTMNPKHFRIGASGLLDDLLANAGGNAAKNTGTKNEAQGSKDY